MIRNRLFLFATCVLLLATAAFAQTGNVAGVVLLPNGGGPAAGATVTMRRMMQTDSLVTTTDAEGHFAFTAVATGGWGVRAILEGYLPAMRSVRVYADQTANVTLTLGAPPTGTGAVAGRVVFGMMGGPAAGATVVLMNGPGDSLVTMSDDSGRFGFQNVAAGYHPIYATLEGYQRANAMVFVPDGGTGRVMLCLRPIPAPPGAVSGTVLESGDRPVPGAIVALHMGHRFIPPVRTDSLGHFAFPIVPAGNYRITAMKRGVGWAAAQITVVTGETTEVTLMLSDSMGGGHRGSPMGEPGESLPEVAVTHLTATNYPNPFNPATTIRFTLPEAGDVTLSVFDVTGRKVADLVNSYQSAGEHAVNFDGSAFASGVYFYRLAAGNDIRTGRMLLMK